MKSLFKKCQRAYWITEIGGGLPGGGAPRLSFRVILQTTVLEEGMGPYSSMDEDCFSKEGSLRELGMSTRTGGKGVCESCPTDLRGER